MAEGPITVYISVGNSDDKLTQEEWSYLLDDITGAIARVNAQVHGFWLSLGTSMYQNACWCIEIEPGPDTQWLRRRLRSTAGAYRQDSIAWAAAQTEFLGRGDWGGDTPASEYVTFAA